jgi:hypothetical protein
MDPEFRGLDHQVEKPAGRSKEHILENLLTLRNEYRQIEAFIKFVYDSIPDGGFMKDGAWVPVEDRDDAAIWSLGPRRKLEEIRWDMLNLLRHTEGLGLKSELITEVEKIAKRR